MSIVKNWLTIRMYADTMLSAEDARLIVEELEKLEKENEREKADNKRLSTKIINCFDYIDDLESMVSRNLEERRAMRKKLRAHNAAYSDIRTLGDIREIGVEEDTSDPFCDEPAPISVEPYAWNGQHFTAKVDLNKMFGVTGTPRAPGARPFLRDRDPGDETNGKKPPRPRYPKWTEDLG